MFEISSQDILDLSDADLRSLVARLALAEISFRGGPLSSVTAGGNQDAADGGLDVRVTCPSDLPNPDFVPRHVTGFQVKKPDMPANAIHAEMCPEGDLRDVIRELAAVSGSYVIISAQGSLADKPLGERRKAMRDALQGIPNAEGLHTDFYDRDRLATWVNKYPGIAAWLRTSVGRPLAGWSGVGDWNGHSDGKPYLVSDKACLIDESVEPHEKLVVLDGIGRLREGLRNPGRCIRLVGMSGLGKTRLVQALFEKEVGADPLDLSITVYTDYSEATNPSARDMARDLISREQRAILIVDNCNPSTHSELAQLCTASASKVSLITVEYDVQDDEPERTDVFRLQAVSLDLVKQWLKQTFADVSQTDCEKIAEFSDGNFRVARALADTIGKGESLGSLKSRDLFERIFQQRNIPSQLLLNEAEELSLLFSIDGKDTSVEGELAHITVFRNTEIRSLYAALVELSKRGIAQARGRFRAVLPQALANPLAAHALERISPEDFDRFCSGLPQRMMKSVSRRLGYLHDSLQAKEAVRRLLSPDGPFGDLVVKDELGIEIITNIAPVLPQEVLGLIQRALDGPNGGQILSTGNRIRHQWIRLIKALAYDATMFDAAAMLLARFLVAEPEGSKGHSASETFSELFHIYLSGTQASPAQRRAMIKQFAESENLDFRRCASLALSGLLKSDHFMSSSNFAFGARPRDFGWQPKINQDIWDWFDQAIALTVELETLIADARTVLAAHSCSLWYYGGSCHDALERATTKLIQGKTWVEGWIAFRTALRFDHDNTMLPELRVRLEQIVARLKPSDLLSQARAVILSSSHGEDFADGEEDTGDALGAWGRALKAAQKIGHLLAKDAETRREFLVQLMAKSNTPRAFACGRGLAEGADDLDAIWGELTTAYGVAEAKTRDPGVLSGFLYQAHELDASFSISILEALVDLPDLAPCLPYFQMNIGLDEEGIVRLIRGLNKGSLKPIDFQRVAGCVFWIAPLPPSLGKFLMTLAALPDGVEFALEFLQLQFQQDKHDERTLDAQLVSIGRELLPRIDFKKIKGMHDYNMATVIHVCCAGEEGEDVAKSTCTAICQVFVGDIALYDLNSTINALFETQPFVSLDAFVFPDSSHHAQQLFNMKFGTDTPIETISIDTLRKWADKDAIVRYPALGKCIRMFVRKNNEDTLEVSPLFLNVLELAPDKKQFLGGFWDRLHPRGWSGSLADILLSRKGAIAELTKRGNEQLGLWFAEITPELDAWIANARQRELDREESFE